MATKNVWRQQSKYFFNERAAQISTAVNTATLCFVSGREQRLWNDPAMYQDLIDSIQAQLSVGSQDALLEVGCAAGFLAQGLAQAVKGLPQVCPSLGVEMGAPEQGCQPFSRLRHGSSAGQVCQQAGELLAGQVDGSVRPG